MSRMAPDLSRLILLSNLISNNSKKCEFYIAMLHRELIETVIKTSDHSYQIVDFRTSRSRVVLNRFEGKINTISKIYLYMKFENSSG